MARAPNTRRGRIGPLSGSLVDELNEVKDGLGTRLVGELNHRFGVTSKALDATAGHMGTVEIVPQRGNKAGLSVNGRIGKVARGISNDDAVNVQQMRELMNCRHFAGYPGGFVDFLRDCAGLEDMAAGAATGIIHAMWGYTYEIPNFTDTDDEGDPGLCDSPGGFGAWWEFIVPATTIIDQVTWYQHDATISPEPALAFALYDMNQSATSFPVVAQTEPYVTTSANDLSVVTLPTTTRPTLDPGRYALAYVGPCFFIGVIRRNPLAFLLANTVREWNPPSFGLFTTDPGVIPDTLDESNMELGGPEGNDANLAGTVPLTYWSDSQEFEE